MGVCQEAKLSVILTVPLLPGRRPTNAGPLVKRAWLLMETKAVPEVAISTLPAMVTEEGSVVDAPSTVMEPVLPAAKPMKPSEAEVSDAPLSMVTTPRPALPIMKREVLIQREPAPSRATNPWLRLVLAARVTLVELTTAPESMVRWPMPKWPMSRLAELRVAAVEMKRLSSLPLTQPTRVVDPERVPLMMQIGRASCRERGWVGE